MALYDRQAVELGGESKIEHSARLFLAPDMMHCGDGAGPDAINATLGIPPRPPVDDARHDIVSAPIAWADGGEAPDRIVATNLSSEDAGAVAMRRPPCPYPSRATYRGFGSTDAAGSFVCEKPAT